MVCRRGFDKARSLGLILPIVTALGCIPQTDVRPPKPVPIGDMGPASWKAEFGAPFMDVGMRGVGTYRPGPVAVHLESNNPLAAANSTSAWTVHENAAQPFRAQVEFNDTRPALKVDENKVVQRLDGSITALASVNQTFTDVETTVRVNVLPPAGGAQTVQSAIARWDAQNRYVACMLDFPRSQAYLQENISDFEFRELAVRKLKVDNKKPYLVSIKAVGQKFRCVVHDERGATVADTGEVAIESVPPKGASGYLIFLSKAIVEGTLHGSFSELQALTPTGKSGPPLVPPTPPTPEAVGLYKQAHAIMYTDPTNAVALYEKALTISPSFIEALTEEAWIRATTSEARLRDPKMAFNLSSQAGRLLAQRVDTRKDRDQYPEEFSPAKMALVMSTIATSLAAMGRIKPTLATGGGIGGNRDMDALAAMMAGCDPGGFATNVLSFVINVTREQMRTFDSESDRRTPAVISATKVMNTRAEQLAESFKRGEVPANAQMIGTFDAPNMNVH
jgi:hypothetical protein